MRGTKYWVHTICRFRTHHACDLLAVWGEAEPCWNTHGEPLVILFINCFILISRSCMYASVTVSTGPKRRGASRAPHQEPPLKHYPSGVFAPHDRWNLLDAVQKAYAISPVVVLVRGERFPSLKIQVLPMTFHFSEFSRCCSISPRFLSRHRLGYWRTLECLGGGAYHAPPPAISRTVGLRGSCEAAFESFRQDAPESRKWT